MESQENNDENRFLFVINIIKGFLGIFAFLTLIVVYCSKACSNLFKWIFKRNENINKKNN